MVFSPYSPSRRIRSRNLTILYLITTSVALAILYILLTTRNDKVKTFTTTLLKVDPKKDALKVD
jgi:hypothetical protein